MEHLVSTEGRCFSSISRRPLAHHHDPVKYWLRYTTSQRRVKLTTLEVLQEAVHLRPQAFGLWQSRLEGATLGAVLAEVQRVPSSRLTDVGKRFVREVLQHNAHRILKIAP